MQERSFKAVDKRLLITSCWHIGVAACRDDVIRRFLQRAKRYPWIHLGDIIDAIAPTDPRYHAGTHKLTIQQQKAAAAEYIERARKTCIGMVVGNHELKLARQFGNITYEITQAAGIPYLAQTVRGPNKHGYTFHFAHPKITFSNKAGNAQHRDDVRQTKLRRFLQQFDGDLKVLGHPHRAVIAPPEIERRLAGRKYVDRCTGEPGWCATCPGCLDGYMISNDVNLLSYVESGGYPPTPPGWLEVAFDKTGVKCVIEYDESGKIVREVEG